MLRALKAKYSTPSRSNGAMLRALKAKYPANTKLFWICGDDVFDWIENPKGLETMREVSGLIVQRRLHKGNTGPDRFFKLPLDENKIRNIGAKLELEIEFIYGELPHFSSTLVRQTPGNWRAFLPQSVAKYLDARPALLEQLMVNLEADAKSETRTNPAVHDAGAPASWTAQGRGGPPAQQESSGVAGKRRRCYAVTK